MLSSLHIKNFIIVEKSDIIFDRGFTVFSGETGAGKSILIDALSLTLGQRTDTSLIREGEDKTDITAVFEVNDNAKQWLMAQDLDSTELVLRRTIDRQGKSKAFINGTPATLNQLKELSEYLVDIHGQHAHQQLLKPNAQRILLDNQGKLSSLTKEVGHAWKQWKKAEEDVAQALIHKEQQNAIKERLEWQLNELTSLNIGKDEWALVNNDYNFLAHASSLLEGVAQVITALDNDHQSICSELSHVCSRLSLLTHKDNRLAPLLESLESARIICTEAVSDLNNYLDKVDLDPQRLAVTEQRMRALFDTAKKFNLEPENLYQYHQDIDNELEKINQTVDIKTLEKIALQCEEDYKILADTLSKKRQDIAKILSQKVTQAMQTLAMQGGQFDIELNPCPASIHGQENVQFKVAGHAGTPPQALNKVASGGELARISLALSVIANQAQQVPTLIFDEVDTGIGGAVADIVGNLLRQLGKSHQVLCVTHLPQVAAYGHHHFEVSKQQEKEKTCSLITWLNDKQRNEEIARMLGGSTITATTREHAKEMLNHAAKSVDN